MDLLLLLVETIFIAIGLWKIGWLVQRYKNYIGIHMSEKCVSVGKFHPIWGHLHLISDVRDFAQLAQKGAQKTGRKISLFWIMFFYPILSVCHPDTAKVLLKSTEPKPKHTGGGYFVFLPWLGDGLLISSGRKWERNRKLLTPAFHFDVLKPYVAIYNHVFDIFMKKIASEATGGKSVEIYEHVGLATLDTMLRCSVSFNENIQEQGSCHPYVQAVRRLANICSERYITPWLFPNFIFNLSSRGREFNRYTKYIHDFDEKVIAERKQALKENTSIVTKQHLDFLDILLSAKDENGIGLTDREIRDEVDTFLFEGHDTTSSGISWAIYNLSKYPNEQQKVYEEVKKVLGDKQNVEWSDISLFKRLSLFLKESMRMYPPVPLIGRITTHELEIDGLKIPANIEINIHIEALNHREDIWTDPECFRPDRFLDDAEKDPYSFVPFSAGPRNCIGQHFALNEMKVALARLVQRFRILPDPDKEPIKQQDAILRSRNGIHVKFEER